MPPKNAHYLSLDILLTALSMLVLMASLFFYKGHPVYPFGGVAMFLFLMGVVDSATVVSVLSNQAIVTIFLLIFLTGLLRNNFDILALFDKFLGSTKTLSGFLLRMNAGVAGISSVVNNTPIVALMIPYLYSYAQKSKISPSKLMMPMAFAATVGGTLTVIGTSTNLVLNGLLKENHLPELSSFDFFSIAIGLTILSVIFLSFIAPKLLPNRPDPADELRKQARNYIVEVKVDAHSNLIGKTVEEAKLRNLGAIFLVEILRNGKIVSPVQPRETLYANDLLFFAGAVADVIELVQRENGLSLPKTEKFALGQQLDVVEAVVPANSNLAGKQVRETNFRERFDAAIIAIHRDGNRLGGKIGGTTINYGDLLLLSAGKDFNRRAANDKNLHPVSTIQQISPENKSNKKIFLMLMALGLFVMALGWLNFLQFLFAMLVVAIPLKLGSLSSYKSAFSPDLYLMLVASVLMGTALIQTGTAQLLVAQLADWPALLHPVVLLVALFFVTVLLTSFVSNVAAVAIIFPVAVALVAAADLNLKPYLLAIAFGASASFLTPVGYQTNLMVFGPGGYDSRDFFKLGLPLTLLYAIVALLTIYMLYF